MDSAPLTWPFETPSSAHCADPHETTLAPSALTRIAHPHTLTLSERTHDARGVADSDTEHAHGDDQGCDTQRLVSQTMGRPFVAEGGFGLGRKTRGMLAL